MHHQPFKKVVVKVCEPRVKDSAKEYGTQQPRAVETHGTLLALCGAAAEHLCCAVAGAVQHCARDGFGEDGAVGEATLVGICDCSQPRRRRRRVRTLSSIVSERTANF